MTTVPYVNLSLQHAALKEELLAAVGEVIDSGRFVLGPQVAEFEAEFAKLCGVDHAIGVGTGTDALVLALRALGIGPGDEVITVPNSFLTTATSVQLVGARTVFIDVLSDYTMDPDQIEQAITPRTKAIMPVHLTGRPCQMDRIMAIANKHGLAVVEDCAQAVQAKFSGQPVGSFGDVGCFSLHPLKTLNACGDGGVMVTSRADIAERLQILRNNGMPDRATATDWSANSRLDTIQAAMLLVKMKYLDAWTEARRGHAENYRQALQGIVQVTMPEDHHKAYSVYHTFVIQAQDRNALRQYLQQQGIKTSIHYETPIHLQPCAAELGYQLGGFPVTERQAQHILSLPVYPELTSEQQQKVIAAISDFYATPDKTKNAKQREVMQ